MVRTDSDSWDLASSVGATATMVAAQRALAAAGSEPLIDDPYAAPLVRAVGIDFFTRLVNGEVPADERGDDVEGAAFDPERLARGMAVRTRFFDQHFLDATQSGIRQAVILAAGLDSRAYRLPWPPETVVYEVDMPQVIEFKTATMRELGAEPTAQRRTVPIDLRDDWSGALAAAGFDPQAPTVWSAEGLLVYLPPAAQDALFDDIIAASAPGSRLACEFIPDTAAFAGEPWRSHQQRMKEIGFDVDVGELIYHGERSHVVEYLSQRGWQVSARTVEQLHADNGFDYHPDNDDDLAKAFADMTYVSAVLGQ